MPSFLSKVFGRKKDEKGSPVRGRGYDGASLLEGKFEVVSPVGSPTTDEFPENAPRSKRKQKDSGLSNVNPRPSRSSSPGYRKDGFPQLPLSLPLSREEAQARALGTGFEGYSDTQFLSDATIGDRRLTPLEALILVRICSQAIVARGLETLGLMHPYWHSASPETQHRLISLFIRSLNDNSPRSSAGPSSFSVFESEINYTLSPHDVAAVLRWGLRHLELGPGGFGNEKTWYRTFAEAERNAGYPPQTYSETLTSLIPAPHLELLDATLDLFSSLAAHSEENSTSASKLTRAFGYWLLIAQRDRERDEWANFYDRWQSCGRILEHLFLARIRNESLRTRMPTRLTGLVAKYPYVEGDIMEDDIFLHLQLSTRQFEALLVRVESELSPREQRHPLQLVKDALAAQVMNVNDVELVSFWERIKEAGDDESEVTLGGYPGIGRIFTDDTLRYLSLVPGNHPWKKSTSAAFNLREVQESPMFRRLASSPGPSEIEDFNRSTNGHTRYTSDPASPAPTGTSALSGDWFQFSSAGFTDASPSALPLASTLFGQDVEKTNPPVRHKRPAKIRSRSPSRARKSTERAVSPAPPVPPVPDLPQLYSQKPTFKSTPTALVEIDEAFIDFWVDALLDPVSSNWPKFVLCKLRQDLPDLQVNNQRVEYIIIEHYFSGLIAPASTPPSSTAPMNIPPKSLERSDLARTISPTKSIPSSPRSSKSEKRRFFNLFSSTSGGGNNTAYASATTSRGKKHRETASSPPERDVGDFGEMMKEKDGKSSSVVKLRMPSPKPRRSVDATRRSDLRGSNVDVSEQVRGRSLGEKGLEKLKESERKRKEAEEKIVKEAEKKREAEEKKRETEEKKREAEEKKRRETEEKKREVEEKKREVEERKRKEAEDKKREVEERKRKEAEEKKRRDGSQGISSIAASAVAAAAVAVATVTTGGSQQTTSHEDADFTDDIRSVEQETEETASEQELEEEAEITPVDSEVTNFEEQPSRVLETIIESPTATEATHGPTGQTFSAPFQQPQDAKKAAADHFFELGVVEESAIQPSTPREPEIQAVAKPIVEARKTMYGNVSPETLAVVIEELVSPQDESSDTKSAVIQATLKPIAADEYAVVEDPAAFSPPSHEPQIAVAQELEGVAVVSEPVEEVSPEPNAAESTGTVATPVSRPDVVTPVVEESTEVAGAAAEQLIDVAASLAVPKTVTAEEFLIIEGPAAFDPSDIDAQIEELNAQISEETGDSESASEEESSSESVAAEERLPFDAVELTPIHEADENEPNLAEDSFEDVVVVEESAEETTLAPPVPSLSESSIPIQAAEILVAEEKGDVLFAEEEEQVAEAEAETETAPVEEGPINGIVMITELSEKPSSTPILEPPSLAADELHERPTATLEKPTFVDVVEETGPPIQDLSSEAAVAVEAAPLVEEYTIVKEGAIAIEAVPVEEEYLAEAVVIEEDPVCRVLTEKKLVPSGPPQAVVSLDEHYTSEELATVEDTEAVKHEKLVTRGVSDEANSYDVAGVQPAVVEENVDAPVEGELTVYRSTIAVTAPVDYEVFEEPEVNEEPPAEKQVDKFHTIEVIRKSSADGFLAPAAQTAAVTPADTTEFIEAEESAVVNEPLIEDHATEPAEDPVAEASATKEPPGSVKDPSTPPLAEAANPYDVLESPAPTIDLIPEANGDGVHAIITEKEIVNEEGAKHELFTPTQGPDVRPFELPGSASALVKED